MDAVAVGYALMLDAIPNELMMERQGFLVSMAVEPKFQNLGVGRKMLLHIEAVARNRSLKADRLMVSHINDSARRLYTSCGYGVERYLLSKEF